MGDLPTTKSPIEKSEKARFESVERARETGSIEWPTWAVRGNERTLEDDVVAHEEPLEIQVQGASIAVLMRTPGHDHELATGFLLTEGIIKSGREVASMRHCSSVKDPEAEENILRVVLADGVSVPPSRLRRNTYASSSCGLCGKATIESTLVDCAPLDAVRSVEVSVIYALPDRLRAAQTGFTASGGVHAAGLFDQEGRLLVLREDVGRHNAVDKVVGYLVTEGLDPAGLILLVSGRISFEIAQKAAVARLPIVIGLSAPTSLAIRFAERAGLTVVGFLRGEKMNVYTGVERIATLS